VQSALLAPEAPAPPPPEPLSIPTECATQERSVCTLPAAFIERLCQSTIPEVALAMFAKGSPWTRGYATRDTRAWYVGGARSASSVLFDEELVVLSFRPAENRGLVISGAQGNYDALRWDGSCVTLDASELTLKRPPKPKAAPIAWKHLDDKTRALLEANARIHAAQEKWDKECHGDARHASEDACVRAHGELSDSVAQYVRGGGELPESPQLP
jgi:hypothetical protein